MKRFEYNKSCEQYADYDSTRESDEVQRMTLVYPADEREGIHAYLSLKNGTTRQISYEEGVRLLREEVEEE